VGSKARIKLFNNNMLRNILAVIRTNNFETGSEEIDRIGSNAARPLTELDVSDLHIFIRNSIRALILMENNTDDYHERDVHFVFFHEIIAKEYKKHLTEQGKIRFLSIMNSIINNLDILFDCKEFVRTHDSRLNYVENISLEQRKQVITGIKNTLNTLQDEELFLDYLNPYKTDEIHLEYIMAIMKHSGIYDENASEQYVYYNNFQEICKGRPAKDYFSNVDFKSNTRWIKFLYEPEFNESSVKHLMRSITEEISSASVIPKYVSFVNAETEEHYEIEIQNA
jgi:hypothetical protein